MSSTEGLEADDLIRLNEDLMKQLDTQVLVFEQYLRVALLQQESDPLKHIMTKQRLQQQNSKDTLFSQPSQLVRLVRDLKQEEGVEIEDPTLAYTIA